MLTLVVALLAANCHAQNIFQPTTKETQTLTAFLQEYVRDAKHDYKTTRYTAAFVDLKDDGAHQVIVYFNSPFLCGSGGCSALILVPKNGSYEVLTRLTTTRPPIRVLITRANGWRDISVHVAGGGIQPPYEAILSFDGKSYPRNPTVPPARKSDHGKIPGKVAISYGDKDQLLFR
jgi:hypothetical protein